jgi:hypothetical protein
MTAPLWVTTFTGEKVTQGKRHEIEWPKLVQRLQTPGKPGQAPLIKLGTFWDDSRATASKGGKGVEMIYGVEGDYDAHQVTMETAAERLRAAGVCAVLYTTKRHTPSTPRWRVLAPLSAPVDPSERAGMLDRLNAALQGCLAPESWEPSRVYFYGQPPAEGPYESLSVDGPLTVDQLPAVEAPQEAQKQPLKAAEPSGRADTAGSRWDALQAGESVHENTRGVVAQLIRNGVPVNVVEAFVEGAVIPKVAEARGHERAEELRDALPRMVQGAADKYKPEAAPTPAPDLASLRVAPLAESLTQTADNYPGTVPLPRDWKLLGSALGTAGIPKLMRGIHVFAGQTGCGKTQLATGFTRAALMEGHPVVYLSLELSQYEVLSRLVALETAYAAEENGTKAVGWPLLAQRAPLSPAQREAVQNARTALQESLSRLYVWSPDPKPGDTPPSVDALRGLVLEAWKTDGKIPLVVVDHLQAPGLALDATRESARLPLRERVAGIIMALRHVSKEGEDGWPGCPVVVLSLVARHITAGKGHVPGFDGGNPDLMRRATLETLKAIPKEAGEIEATAVTLWAMASAQPKEGDQKSRMTLRLAKSRMSRSGKWIPLEMDGFTGRLRDDERRYDIAQQEDKKAKEDAAARRKKAEAGGDA